MIASALVGRGRCDPENHRLRRHIVSTHTEEYKKLGPAQLRVLEMSAIEERARREETRRTALLTMQTALLAHQNRRDAEATTIIDNKGLPSRGTINKISRMVLDDDALQDVEARYYGYLKRSASRAPRCSGAVALPRNSRGGRTGPS